MSISSNSAISPRQHVLYKKDAGLPLLDRRSSIRTNFCWEPGKSTANSVSTLPRSLRRGLRCFMLNTKLSFLITSSTWWLASAMENIQIWMSQTHVHFVISADPWNKINCSIGAILFCCSTNQNVGQFKAAALHHSIYCCVLTGRHFS